MKNLRSHFCPNKILLLGMLCLPPHVAHAVVSEAPKTEIFGAAYMLQVAGSLLFVIGCLLALLFVVKKLNNAPVGDRKTLRILSSVKVGSREKIMLLDTGEAQVLVGVAAGGVRTLYVYQGSAADGVADIDNAPEAPANDFASLMSATGRSST